jgi:hypothetical protein
MLSGWTGGRRLNMISIAVLERSQVKDALRLLWQENETRVARYPLLLGVVFVILASVLGVFPEERSQALARLLSGR